MGLRGHCRRRGCSESTDQGEKTISLVPKGILNSNPDGLSVSRKVRVTGFSISANWPSHPAVPGALGHISGWLKVQTLELGLHPSPTSNELCDPK